MLFTFGDFGLWDVNLRMILWKWTSVKKWSIRRSLMQSLINSMDFLLFIVWTPYSHQGEENLDQVKGKAYLKRLEGASTKLEDCPDIYHWSDNINHLVNTESAIKQNSPDHLEEFSAQRENASDFLRLISQYASLIGDIFLWRLRGIDFISSCWIASIVN